MFVNDLMIVLFNSIIIIICLFLKLYLGGWVDIKLLLGIFNVYI